MELHQLTYTLKTDQALEHANAVTEWHPSHRSAVVRRLELFRAGKLLGPKKNHPIEQVDVPTRKPDLLAWLNRECV